jgi:hypothetical protein
MYLWDPEGISVYSTPEYHNLYEWDIRFQKITVEQELIDKRADDIGEPREWWKFSLVVSK